MGNSGPKPFPLGSTALGVKTKMPRCPKHLDDTARKEWRRVAPLLYAYGLLTEFDAAALACYCQSFSRWVDCEGVLSKEGLTFITDKGYEGQKPEVAIANKCMRAIKDFCKEFGLTPNARGKMVLPNKPKDDKGFDF